MAKKTISELSAAIQNYAAKTEPLSIDPILDGGIKQDILDTLNNKAYNATHLRLSALPSNVFLTSEQGNNGEYSIYTQAPLACILLKKVSGVWNVIPKTNAMVFFFDAVDGTRYYYAFSDDLNNPIQTHSINLANPTGTAVLTTPQTLTNEEKIQAQINIDAASKSYIDNAIAALKNSGAVGSSVAGSVMAWFGTETSIPQDWMLIPNEETFLLKSEYPDLYAALGGEDNVFGVTETLFALPYLSGGTSIIHTSELFPLGQKGGEETHILDISEMPEHSHIINLDTVSGVEETGINAVNANSIVGGSVQTENSGSGLAHNNLPPYIAANYIIKTKNTGGSFTASVDETNHLILTFADGSVQDAGLINMSNYSTISDREAGDLWEDLETGTTTLNAFYWKGTPAFHSGYFTIASPFNKYCIYYGTNPELEGYIAILYSDLVDITAGVVTLKLYDNWDFIVINEGLTFIAKKVGERLESPNIDNFNSYIGIGNAIIGTNTTIKPKAGFELSIENVKDLSNAVYGEYNLTLKKIDLVWIDGFIKIPHTEQVNYQKLIKDVSLKADFGSGLVELDAVVNYPSAETYNSIPYQGFYLRDSQNLITELADFQTIHLSYNIEILTDDSYRYDGLKENLGINVIESEVSGNPSHVAGMQLIFNTIYPDFAGTYTATPNDSLANNTRLGSNYRMTYAELKDADLIFVPMQFAATDENVATNPNVLIVAAHYSNDFVEHYNTAGAGNFLSNVIAVNSCTATGTPGIGTCTSYGDPEFSEDLVLLETTYPAFDSDWNNPVYQESATCAVVAAKLKKIKIDSGASWSMVRKAARATAYNPRNPGGWDIYMGFGIIDVEAAKTYLAGWTSGLDYRKEQADKIQRINKFVTFDDLDENCPMTKKMFLDYMAAH